MKKIMMGFALSLITLLLTAQVENRKYDVYFLDYTDKFGGIRALPIGAFLRNDTIFIEPGAIVNVVAVHSEDSIWKPILLRPYREKWVWPNGVPTVPNTSGTVLIGSVPKKTITKQIKKQ